MRAITNWFREFWARPTATRAAILIAFLAISSLYCVGIASVVASARRGLTTANVPHDYNTPTVGPSGTSVVSGVDATEAQIGRAHV